MSRVPVKSERWTLLAFVILSLLSAGLVLQALTGWPLSAVVTLDPAEMKKADGDLAKKYRVPGEFGAWRPAEFRGTVTEDGRPLGPRVWTNREVHHLAKGRYRIDGRQLVFSASDETDPQSNGRHYQVRLPIDLPAWLIGVAMTATILLGVHLVRRHRSLLSAVRRRGIHRWLPGLPAGEKCLPSSLRPGGQPHWSTAVSLAILAVPSVWLWASFEPFWRDIDALVQVGFHPQHGNIVHFPPLYCWAARIPLYWGAALEGRHVLPASFVLEPRITETGVRLLIGLQHIALILTEFWLIRVLAGGWIARIALAAAFATFLPTYTFAHCVGSEALASVLQLAGCAACVALLRRRGAEGRWRYVVALFWLSVAAGLTRHSAVLMAGMPAAISFAGLLLVIPAARRRGVRIASYARSLAGACLFVAAAYLACGAVTRVACWIADIEYKPDPGITFFWRMKQIDGESNQEFLSRFERAAEYTTDPILKQGLQVLVDRLRSGESYGTDIARIAFGDAAAAAGAPEDFYEATNKLPGVFYRASGTRFATHVVKDLMHYFDTYPQYIASQPVETTGYFLDEQHQRVAQRLAGLKRFRGSAESDLQDTLDHVERATWVRIPGWAFLALALLAMGVLASPWFHYSKGRTRPALAGASHVPAAATLFGILAPAFVWALAHAALTESLPRFVLPTHLNLMVAALAAIAFVCQRNRAISARGKCGGVL